ncbi:unnamed protein product [Effrenium voratum]|nr:unnamed protein product [Effrenium voratum]
MDPRIEYNEVDSIIGGLDDSCISEREKSRLQLLMSSSSEHHVLQSRTRLVLEHFSSTCGSLSYRAQAIVLCCSREEVLRATKLARQVARERVDLGMTESEILGAFSSHVDGETEKHLNGFFLKSASDAKKARLLFVAHKFETGYDNPAVTCLYVFRKIDASTLATQVLLRHCSKRAGKIRPITVDFANRDGQLLEAMSMYFGDVSCQPWGQVVRERPEARPRAVGQASSRKAIEKHLMSRIHLERLEVRRVPTPQHGAVHAAVAPTASNSSRAAHQAARSEVHTDLMLLKIIPPGQALGGVERSSLSRLQSKAAAGHMGTLASLSRGEATAAMKKVLRNGEKSDQQQALAVLEQLQKVDPEAEKVYTFAKQVQDIGSQNAEKCHGSVLSVLGTLAKDPSLSEIASKLGASEAGIKALTKFGSFSLSFGQFFGGFDTPFFAGRNATFYRTIWKLLGQLHDDDALLAVSCKTCVDDLKNVQKSSADDSARLKALKNKISLAGNFLLKALVAEGLVDSLAAVMAFGDVGLIQIAESILFRLQEVSNEAGRLSFSRRVLQDLLQQKELGADDLELAQGFLAIAVPRKHGFPFSVNCETSLEGRVLHRFGVTQLAQRVVRLQDRTGALAKEVLQSPTYGAEIAQPAKRLRCA